MQRTRQDGIHKGGKGDSPGTSCGQPARVHIPMKLTRGPTVAHTDNLLSRISVNPKVMVGKPTIRGLRITVEQILRALASGITEEELLDEYPELQKEDFQAVFAYATGLVEMERVYPVCVSA